MYACGGNSFGQLGLDDNKNRDTFTPICNFKAVQIATSSSHTLALTEQGHLYVCGNNLQGQFGLNDRPSETATFTRVDFPEGKIVQIAVGKFHTVILTDKGSLYVCGNNRWGQLGLSNNINRCILTPIPFFSIEAKCLVNFIQIKAIIDKKRKREESYSVLSTSEEGRKLLASVDELDMQLEVLAENALENEVINNITHQTTEMLTQLASTTDAKNKLLAVRFFEESATRLIGKAVIAVIACATGFIISTLIGAAVGASIGIVAGAWTGPGAAVTGLAGLFTGTVTGAALGVAISSVVLGVVTGTTIGALTAYRFFKTPKPSANNIAEISPQSTAENITDTGDGLARRNH